MTEINKEQLAVWANGYRCDSDMAIKTMAKMLLDFMNMSEKEPVTWPDMPFSFEELEQMHGATFANGYIRGWARKCESVTMKGSLYTTPQPAHTEQVIPSEIPKVPHNGGMAYKKGGSIYSTNYARGWNDCVQNMLAAAPKPESE